MKEESHKLLVAVEPLMMTISKPDWTVSGDEIVKLVSGYYGSYGNSTLGFGLGRDIVLLSESITAEIKRATQAGDLAIQC